MMRRASFLVLLSCVLSGFLQAQVNTPRVGFARCADHFVRAIFGLHSDFIVDGEAVDSADAVSFSDSGGLVAKGGIIQLRDRNYSLIAEYKAGETTPLLNIDRDLSTAIAWLPNRHALLHWNGEAFAAVEVNGNGLLERVASVWMQDSKNAKLLITEKGGAVSEATVSLESGDLIALQLLAGIQGPAFHHQSYILFPGKEGLEIAHSGASLQTLPLAAPDLTIERMSSDWLHLSSARLRQNWVLHLKDGGAIELSELPASPSAVQQELGK